MSRLKTITVPMIRDWQPCYDPTEKLPEDWTGTVLDVLGLECVSVADRFWVILRSDFLSEKLMRLFAVWCARQVEHLMEDQISKDALNVAERFANGQATLEELGASWDASWYAAMGAAMAVARGAARAAAWYAARAAVRAASRDDAQVKKLKEMIISGIETGDIVLEEK